MTDEAESFGKIWNLDWGGGLASGGFKNDTKVTWDGHFEGSTKFDRIGPDGLVGALHNFAFGFGHESLGSYFWGDAGVGVFIHSAF